MANNNSQSFGYNVAISPESKATTDGGSLGFNFICAASTGSIEQDSAGFNFATGSAEANISDSFAFNVAVGSDSKATAGISTNAINMATDGATAAYNDGNGGFSFAAGTGAKAENDFGGNTFNFAAGAGSSMQAAGLSSDGFNIAIGEGSTALGIRLVSSFNYAGLNSTAESGSGSLTSSDTCDSVNFACRNATASGLNNGAGFNFAADGGKALSRGSSSFNFAGEKTGISTKKAAHAYNIAVTGDVSSSDSITIDDGDNDNANRLCNIVVGSGSSLTIDNPSQTAAINAIADGGSLTNPGNGVNVNTGTSAMRVFTDDTYRWQFTQQGGINASLNSPQPVEPGQNNSNTGILNSDRGFNLLIGARTDDTGATPAPQATTDGASQGFNVGIGPDSRSISTNGSQAFNLTVNGGTSSTDGGARAVNFAIDSADIEVTTADAGINMALGSTTTIEVSDSSNDQVINLATGGATVTNPGNGVNIDPGSGEFRLSNLASQDEDEVLTISSAGVVGITSKSDITSTTSTRNIKRNIESIDDSHMHLLDTTPVQFNYRSAKSAKDDNQIHYGFIAEDWKDILPELVRYDANGHPTKIRYIEIVPLLVKHIQELRNIVSQQHEEALYMQLEIEEHKQKIAYLQNMLDQVKENQDISQCYESDNTVYIEMIPILMDKLQQQQGEIAYLRSLYDA